MEVMEEQRGVIPERTPLLEEIPEMESAKRALEISLVGGHGIVLVCNAHAHAIDIVRTGSRIADKLGIPFHGLAYPVCKCGHYGAFSGECRCSPVTLRRHLTELGERREEFDIWLEACPKKPPEVDIFAAKRALKEEVFSKEILTARQARERIRDADCDGVTLLREYQRSTGRRIDVGIVLGIARSIASLDLGETRMRTEHIAEALQYQASAIYWLWDSIEARRFEAKVPAA